MGKVILEFDSVEEQSEIKSALDGYKWKLLVWDLDQELRAHYKHGISILKRNENAEDIEIDVIEKVRELIRDYMSSYNINLEE